MEQITLQAAIQRQLALLQADFNIMLDHCIARRVVPPQIDDMQRRLDRLQRWARLLH